MKWEKRKEKGNNEKGKINSLNVNNTTSKRQGIQKGMCSSVFVIKQKQKQKKKDIHFKTSFL